MTKYTIKFKDDEQFYVEMEEDEVYEYDGTKYIFESQIKKTEDNNKIGYMNFNKKNGKIWLYKIEIDEDYRGKGIGSKMMKLLEYLASSQRCSSIEGKYYPTVNFGEHFYKKNGYSIEKDGYETEIFKYLDRDIYKKYEDNFQIEVAEEKEENIEI